MARSDGGSAEKPNAAGGPAAPPPSVGEAEVADIAKRHRVSPAIVREIMRSTGAAERPAIEREIQKGKARR